MNLEYIGAEQSFTVLAGSQPEYELEFRRDEVPISVRNVTFDGLLVAADGSLQVVQVDHVSEEENVLRVAFPFLPEPGCFDYEIAYTTEQGSRYRLAFGKLEALSTQLDLEQLEELERDARRVAVNLPGVVGGHIQLLWRAGLNTTRALTTALAAAKKLEGVDDTLGNLAAQVEEYRVFVAQWRNEAANVLVMNPVTGTIWVGNTDTGQPYRGEPGRAPRVNAYGFWEVYEDGQWVTLPYRAAGQDGIDGDQVRRVLIGSVSGLPVDGERGVLYYVPKTVGVGDAAADGQGEWNALEVEAEVLPEAFRSICLPGVYNSCSTPVWLLVRTDAGKVLGVSSHSVTWEEGENVEWCFDAPVKVPAGCRVRMFLSLTNEATNAVVPVPGVHVKSRFHEGGEMSMRYVGQWYGQRTVYFEVGSMSGGFDMWAWVEPVGWLCVGHDPYGVATATSLGLVMVATDVPVEGGAPVGLDALQRLSVVQASSTVPGASKVSSDDRSENGGKIHISASGSLFADVASASSFGSVKVSTGTVLTAGGIIGVNADGQLLCRLATPDNPGAVRPGSYYQQLLERPYLLSVGVDGQGRLANCLLKGGALQHMLPSQWVLLKENGSMVWIEDEAFPVEGAHYFGLKTTRQFGQSQEEGLYLNPAETNLLAGVYLAPGLEDTRMNAVLPAPTMVEHFAQKKDVYDKDTADGRFMNTQGGCLSVHVCAVDEDLPPANEMQKGCLYIAR